MIIASRPSWHVSVFASLAEDGVAGRTSPSFSLIFSVGESILWNSHCNDPHEFQVCDATRGFGKLVDGEKTGVALASLGMAGRRTAEHAPGDASRCIN